MLATVAELTSPLGVAVDPVTNLVYVADALSETVAVVDGATDQVIATIPVAMPHALALNPATNLLYVSDHPFGFFGVTTTVTVIDTETHAVVTTIPNLPREARDIAVNPATNRIYLPHLFDDSVSVIDGNTNGVVGTITGIDAPYAVAVNPLTNRVYVASVASSRGPGNTVAVVDGATNTLIASVPVGSGPIEVAVNPITNRVYTSNFFSGTTSVIDGGTNTVVATLPVGSNPRALEVNTQTNQVYVGLNTKLVVIDGVSDTITGAVPVCGNRVDFDLAVNETTDKVYLASGGRYGLTVLGNGPGDVVAPTITTPIFTVNPKTVAESTTFTVDVADETTQIAGGEYFVGSDPGIGSATPLPVFFPTTSLSATIGTSLEPGVYTVGVRGRDEACNWSDTAAGFLVVYDRDGGFVSRRDRPWRR